MPNSLQDCHIEPLVQEGFSITQQDISNRVLYIVPNDVDTTAGNAVALTVSAANFEDKTYLLDASEWEGIASGSGAGGLGITLEDEGIAGTPSNRIIVTVDLDDSFSLTGDHTINLDIHGKALPDSNVPAIIALVTDFQNQVHGGQYTTTDDVGVSTSHNYPGVSGVAKVTFTPAAGMTDPRNNSFAPTNSTTIPDIADGEGWNNMDANATDEVIYVKGNFTTDRSGPNLGWVKVGDITVELDSTALSNAVTANNVPSSDSGEGEYGFVFTSEYSGQFEELGYPDYKPAIYIDPFSPGFVNGWHELRFSDRFGVIQSNPDFLTGVDLHTTEGDIEGGFWYGFKRQVGQSGTATSTRQASNRTFLGTKWTREWWFRYPTQDEISEIIGDTYGGLESAGYIHKVLEAPEFWHEESDDMNKGDWTKSDLLLRGLLQAAPPTELEVKTISNVSFQSNWEDMVLSTVNGWAGVAAEAAEPGSTADKAWMIPWYGNDPNNNGQVLSIIGQEGAQFKVEIDQVDQIRSTDGKSLGDTINTFRSLVQWDDVLDGTDPGENNEFGTTNVLTINGSGIYELQLPSIPAHISSGTFNNYYLRVIAQPGTRVYANAQEPYGADIEGEFTGGINYNGPGNTLQIRMRQEASQQVTLTGDISHYAAHNELVEFDSSSGTQTVPLFSANQNLPENCNSGFCKQTIEFRWVLKPQSGSGYWKFNPGMYEYISNLDGSEQSRAHTQIEHAYKWPNSVCNVSTNNMGAADNICSIGEPNRVSTSTSVLDENKFLITHNYPIPAVVSDTTNLIANSSMSSGVSSYDILEHNSGNMTTGFFYGSDVAPGSISSSGNAANPAGTGNGLKLQGQASGGAYTISHFSPMFYCAPAAAPTSDGFADDGIQVVAGVEYTLSAHMFLHNAILAIMTLSTWDDELGPVETLSQIYVTPSSSGNGYRENTFTSNYTGKVVLTGTYSATSTTDPESGHAIFDNISLRQVDVSSPANHLEVFENGDEITNIKDIRCVLGKATGWDYADFGVGSIGNDANFDDYLSVLGRFEVITFGTHSNDYVFNIRDIATWVQT